MTPPIWYYARGTERVGPITLEQLRALAASGQLRPEENVWTDGMPQWAPAGSRPELFGDAAGATGTAVLPPRAMAQMPLTATVAVGSPQANPVGYYVSTIDMPARAVANLRRHAMPTGDTGDWPLDDARVAVFRETMKLRKKVVAAAQLYKSLFALSLIGGLFFLIIAVGLGTGRTFGGGTGGGVLAMGLAIPGAMIAGFAVLYAFAWRATARSRRWAPITMFVVFTLSIGLNVLTLVVTPATGSGVAGAMVVSVIVIVLMALFAAVSWGAVSAIPRYLAKPAWCQELIAASEL
jgi:hypothetical protein